MSCFRRPRVISRHRNSRYKRKKRMKLFNKQNGICPICEKRMNFRTATLDHILPLSRGGTWLDENMQVTHRLCNRKKKNLTNVEFRTKFGTITKLNRRLYGNHRKVVYSSFRRDYVRKA